MQEYNVNPRSIFQTMMEERQRKLEAELAGVEQEDAETLLAHIKEAQLRIPDLGAGILYHVNNIGGIAANGDLVRNQHVIALTLLRLKAWVTKYNDESKFYGSDIHFMRLQLEIIKGQIELLVTTSGLDPWPECQKSLDAHWDNF